MYPARNPFSDDLDNLQPLQYQEQAAPLGAYGNCALCHGEPRDVSAHHPLVRRSSTAVHPPEGAQTGMPPAIFSHQAHVQAVNCTVCHHTGHEDGKPLQCTNSGCHDSVNPVATDPATGKTEPDPRYFYTAFHGPYPGCVSCHTKSLAAGRPAGPTDCQACHQAPSSRWQEEREAGGG